MKVFIVDIDGTIADNKHREHLIKEAGWDAFFEACDKDKPIEHMRVLLAALCEHAEIIYVTGRPERMREKTIYWLLTYGFPVGHSMYMRQDGDHRPDHLIKDEILDALLARDIVPIMAFDDRQQVVDMWRDNGVPCAQVAPSFD
jgi:hypothetical protein